MEQEIAFLWQELESDHCYNGRLARLDFWNLQQGTLQLVLSPTDYRTLLFSNKNIERIAREWGESFFSRALGVSAVVVSSDHQLLLMQRSDRVGEYPDCFDVFGGHIDVEGEERAPSVFGAISQELEEELNLRSGDYSLQCLGLGESIPNRKPELVFVATSELPCDEIISCAGNAADAMEYSRLFAIPNKVLEVTNFLQESRNQLSPSAFGSICLYANLML